MDASAGGCNFSGRMFQPSARYDKPWSGAVLVLADGHIPTVDYYIKHRLQSAQHAEVCYADVSQAPNDDMVVCGLFVVIVRYCSAVWLHFLKQYAEQLSGVAFVMDDDLPAAWRCQDIPLDYRVWTGWRYWKIQHSLSALCDRIWVSTPALLERYGLQAQSLLPPVANLADIQPMTAVGQRWGYHGTRVHHLELKWLLPVVAAVQRQMPDAVFEVFGDDRVRAMFAHIPRVVVLPYLSWPDYLEYCRHSTLSLALAPLLPGRFNSARAMVKVYDMLRCGAAGVFSQQLPYLPLQASGIHSVLANNHDVWSENILRLLTDSGQRQLVYDAMQHWAMTESMHRPWTSLLPETVSNT